MSKGKFTAVQWSWRDDKNKWIDYDAAAVLNLETEHQKGSKKIKVDKERFIDLSLSHDEIVKNFNKLDDEEHLLGVQRRYDDETKRRAVRRVVPEFFDKETFLLLGKYTKKDKTDLTNEIELYSGIVAAKFTKKTTIAVIPEDEVEENKEDVKQAKDNNVPVVKLEYVADCIKKAKKLPTKDYVVELKAPATTTTSSNSNSSTTTTAAKNKRKKSGSDSESEKQTKTAKTDNSNSSQTSTTTTASTPAPAPTTASTASIIPQADVSIEQFKDAPSLKVNTQWMGTSTSEADGSTFPMIMQVKERKSDSFSGEIQWPTLNSAKTKFKGTIKGEQISFEEYEVIVGQEDVEIPMKYSASIKDQEMSGKNEHSDPDMASTFSLKKIAAVPSKDFDVVKPSTKWNGTVYQPYNFVFEITKRKAGQFEGEITWPDINNAKTKVRGNIEGDEISFEEYESQSTDVVIPANYIAKFINKKIQGKFKAQTTGGIFEMDLNK